MMNNTKLGEDLRGKTAEKINALALTELNNSMYSHALDMMIYNAKKNPSVQTYNNLGVFYFRFGKYSWRRKISLVKYRLAEKYLKKACETGTSYFSLSELGFLYFDQERYKDAELYFSRALEIEQRPEILNNLGASEYFQKKYSEAGQWFYRACQKENSDEKMNILDSYGISLAKSGDTSKAKEVLTGLLDDTEDYEVDCETFILAYLCHEFNVIYDNYESLVLSCSLDNIFCKIVVHSLILLGKYNQAEEFKRKVRAEWEEREYITKKDRKQYEQDLLEATNKKSGYFDLLYYPKLMFQCNFYGCKHHHNAFNILEK